MLAFSGTEALFKDRCSTSSDFKYSIFVDEKAMTARLINHPSAYPVLARTARIQERLCYR